MTWTKLSDDYSDDCWTLSDAAFRLHTEALIWSNRKLLDCVIPKDDLPRFARRPEVVPELIDTGWWDEDEQNYILRHHARYQRLREKVLAQQEANRANGRKGGRPTGPAREQVEDIKPPNPVANPVAKQVENQKGQDRTGQEHLEEQPQEEVIWPEVKMATPLPVADDLEPTCLECGRPIFQQRSIGLGLCEPCEASARRSA